MTLGAIQQTSGVGGGARGDAGYIVRSGDTLSGIAQSRGIRLAALIRANPQISNPDLIRVGQHVTVPTGSGEGGGGASYTVRAGDTLSGIASRYGTNYQAIAHANGIGDPSLIRPGQTLSIAGGSAGAGSRSGAGGSVGATGGAMPGRAPGDRTGNVAQIAEKYLGRTLRR